MNCVCVFPPIPPTSLRTRPSTSKGRLFRGCFHCSAVILLLLLVILRNRCFWYRSRECHVNFVVVCTLHNSYVYLITSSTASSLYPFTTTAIHSNPCSLLQTLTSAILFSFTLQNLPSLPECVRARLLSLSKGLHFFAALRMVLYS